ncbi:MAG TPA: L,D-transpeptidase [Mycobacterium sp.]|nr:L,D-transpeptidase [Mycobacterium sp.]
MSTRTGADRRWASWKWTSRTLTSAFCAGGMVAAVVMAMPSALADPDQDPGNPPPAPPAADAAANPGQPPAVVAPAPPDPSVPTADVSVPYLPPPPAVPGAVDATGPAPAAQTTGPVAGQDPTPFTGTPPFRPPTFDPPNGATVGVAKPIVINFAVPIGDRGLAQSAVHISSTPAVPGHFYWMNDQQLRWRPEKFWPAHTAVHIDAAGTVSSFTTGDELIATADDATHQMTITRNGVVEKTFPISMGQHTPKLATGNGTYYVSDKYPKIVMDSSTFGIPVDSPMGYKVTVYDAARISNTGIFVHAAPWSISDQGKRDVSHGCINISPENAKWFMANFNKGDPVIVKNSMGTYNQNDGYDDWQR